MTRRPTSILSSRNWAGRVSAALIAGFTASLAATCIYLRVSGVKDGFFDARGQIAMWALAPLWIGLLGFCFLFRSGLRAWGWLAAANLVLWSVYFALRLSGT